jgi:hypothetical protein
MSQFCKIELQVHDLVKHQLNYYTFKWPIVYGYSFNFSYFSHDLSKFYYKSILENLYDQPI